MSRSYVGGKGFVCMSPCYPGISWLEVSGSCSEMNRLSSGWSRKQPIVLYMRHTKKTKRTDNRPKKRTQTIVMIWTGSFVEV